MIKIAFLSFSPKRQNRATPRSKSFTDLSDTLNAQCSKEIEEVDISAKILQLTKISKTNAQAC